MADIRSALNKLSPNTRRRLLDGFHNVLRSTAGRKIYRQFLQEYFEEENNVTFWEMCNDLVEHYEEKDMDTRQAAARKIWGYAANLGNFINLDERQLRQLRNAIDHPKPDGMVLLECLHDIRNSAFDWLEERYANFLECCGPNRHW